MMYYECWKCKKNGEYTDKIKLMPLEKKYEYAPYCEECQIEEEKANERR